MSETPDNTYSTQPHNRQSVEALELGTLAISFTNVRVDWLEEDNVQRLRSSIDNTIEALKDVIPGCQLLRLVAMNPSLYDEYHKWKHETGWEDIVLPEPTNEYWGKAFVWGDGRPATTWSVWVLPEFTADSLKSSEDLRYGKCRLVHDLTHIHSEALYLRYFGRSQPIRSNDWPRLVHYYTYLIWSEYFAEVVSCRYSPQCFWYSNHNLQGSLHGIVRCTELIPDLLEDHRTRGHVYWATALSRLDATFSSLGRVLGNLQGGEEMGNRLTGVFLDQLSERDPVWGENARQLQNECHYLLDKDWDTDLLEALENTVLGVLVNCGIQEAGVLP